MCIEFLTKASMGLSNPNWILVTFFKNKQQEHTGRRNKFSSWETEEHLDFKSIAQSTSFFPGAWWDGPHWPPLQEHRWNHRLPQQPAVDYHNSWCEYSSYSAQSSPESSESGDNINPDDKFIESHYENLSVACVLNDGRVLLIWILGCTGAQRDW